MRTYYYNCGLLKSIKNPCEILENKHLLTFSKILNKNTEAVSKRTFKT